MSPGKKFRSCTNGESAWSSEKIFRLDMCVYPLVQLLSAGLEQKASLHGAW
ncbi:hypothetical protein ANACOL_02773 [Anaerotruncus colihominis DSM 17241]|uniref:Uncharacterized protein n=1 Tax=Anaerotruncus colihominis DSM 17241 TaxID=445972 RepID=B0PDY8_9FIRM|nr:hypothetical protein ANACOL_02773 [Anaerotruncus colihominis DSM 17241]